ncbi:MAG: Uma2 family endonuclease [Trichodesmium sp. MO_231.B1]|nr:Uma2 family endonuclease [Trichodesmium sp. MO_231.B1]
MSRGSEHFICGDIQIFALAFPYDAPLQESAGLPTREVKLDREVKIPLYGEDNIIEVWLVDINDQCVEVYRQPIASGYEQVQKLQRGQSLSIQRFPSINIQVDEILG